MNHSKIYDRHLERKACVYIRQSSLRQVEENLESQDLQYQLVHRARTFGWVGPQIEIIDDDLGKSGTSSQERAGFQNLVADISIPVFALGGMQPQHLPEAWNRGGQGIAGIRGLGWGKTGPRAEGQGPR